MQKYGIYKLLIAIFVIAILSDLPVHRGGPTFTMTAKFKRCELKYRT
jgi:hypothetical protein